MKAPNYLDVVTREELESQYDLTDKEEREYVFGDGEFSLRYSLVHDPDLNLCELAFLYLDRGDLDSFKFYRSQIQDPQRLLDLNNMIADSDPSIFERL